MTLTVNVVGPTIANGYVLRHRMVQAGEQWFEQMQRLNATVVALNDAAAYSGTPPANWVVGQPQTYTFTVTNTGNGIWSAGGANPVRLGVYFGGISDAVGDWSAEPIRVPLTRDVQPGESLSLSVTMWGVPIANGYVLRHRMVREGIGWFDQLRKTNATVVGG